IKSGEWCVFGRDKTSIAASGDPRYMDMSSRVFIRNHVHFGYLLLALFDDTTICRREKIAHQPRSPGRSVEQYLPAAKTGVNQKRQHDCLSLWCFVQIKIFSSRLFM
ncbi:MAG: hypothetical protein Q7U12_16585, partial [Undibacterium sp.]|nr:hypothetical protein [Undibacterium sp.]